MLDRRQSMLPESDAPRVSKDHRVSMLAAAFAMNVGESYR
jgi:hypothetical protein